MRKIYLLTISLILFFAASCMAQLVVQGGYTPLQLANKLVGAGVTVSNVTYTGAYGAAGAFKGYATDLGLDSGVLLTTGGISYSVGPNYYTDLGLDNYLSGDVDLMNLSGDSTYDATILEFDFVPTFTNVKFRYVFGSEEYPEFVCSYVNDVFAFFISGPGIVGQKNLAQIPNTGIPVSINTLNGGIASDSSPVCYLNYSQYYVDNEWPNGTYIEYDGFTTVLTAQTTVIPNNTYHIRLAIADGGDGIYDSGVFLEAGSFSGTTSVPPVANFQASKTVLCANDCISYTNSSIDATSWKWSFPGAIPSSSTDQNPSFVCYTTPGVYNATLIASNNVGKDTLTYTNYINVAASPPVPTIFQNGSLLYCKSNPAYVSFQWYFNSAPIPGATDTSVIASKDGNYNVEVSNSNGCKVAVGINIVLGMLNLSDQARITVAAGELTLYSSSIDWRTARAVVMNVLGQSALQGLTLQRRGEQAVIDVSSLSRGVYFLHVETEQGVILKKFVKE